MAFLNKLIKKMLNEDRNTESVLDKSYATYTEEEIAEAEKIFNDLENDSSEVVNVIKNKANDEEESTENKKQSKEEMIDFIKQKIKDIEHFNRLFQIFTDCKNDWEELQNNPSIQIEEEQVQNESEKKTSFWDEL